MKPEVFAILVLCATAVYADVYEYSDEIDSSNENELIPIPRAMIIDNIKHTTNAFIRKSMAEFHKVEAKFVKIAEKIREVTETVARKTKKEVRETVDAVKRKVKQIARRGEHFFHCIKLNFPEFIALTKTTASNVISCGKNIVHVVSDFEKQAAGYAADLVKTLGHLGVIIAECAADGAITAGKCALNHIKDAEQMINSTITDFLGIVDAIRDQSGPLLKELTVCKNENFSAIGLKYKEVENKMNECASYK